MLREAQWKAIGMIPNGAMISTNDLVEPYERFNIHPANKAAVGKRLCDLALNKTYGKKQFPVESPRYRATPRFTDGAAWVAVILPSDGICRNYMIEGFEIAGPDKSLSPCRFCMASLADQRNGRIKQESSWIRSPYVTDGVISCRESPCRQYLPLIPFRTDDWVRRMSPRPMSSRQRLTIAVRRSEYV